MRKFIATFVNGDIHTGFATRVIKAIDFEDAWVIARAMEMEVAEKHAWPIDRVGALKLETGMGV